MSIGLAVHCRDAIVVAADSSVCNDYGPVLQKALKLIKAPTGAFMSCGNLSEGQRYGQLYQQLGLTAVLDILRETPASDLEAMVVENGRVYLFGEDGSLSTSRAASAVIGSGGELAQMWLDGWESGCGIQFKRTSAKKAVSIIRHGLVHVARADYQVRGPFAVHILPRIRSVRKS